MRIHESTSVPMQPRGAASGQQGEVDRSSSLSSLFAEDVESEAEDLSSVPHRSHISCKLASLPQDERMLVSQIDAPPLDCSMTSTCCEVLPTQRNGDYRETRHLDSALFPGCSEDDATARVSKSVSRACCVDGVAVHVCAEGVSTVSDGGVSGGQAGAQGPTVTRPAGLSPLAAKVAGHLALPPIWPPSPKLHVQGLSPAPSNTPAPAFGHPGSGPGPTSIGMPTPGSAGTQAAPLGMGAPCANSTGTTPLPPYSHTRHGGGAGISEEALQSLVAYMAAEAQPAEKLPTADVVWGQTERDRVYNFLLHVPYQLERLIWFGSLILVDCFLGVFTLLPLRCAVALYQLFVGPFTPRRAPESGSYSFSESSTYTSSLSAATGSERVEAAVGPSFSGTSGAAAAAAALATPLLPQPSAGVAAERRPPPRLSGSQVYDLLCLGILCVATAILRTVRPGSIYYWLKDITSEFLKMSVLSTAFDISDKILSNFGKDVLEALSGTCTQWLAGKKRVWHVAADALVATTIVTLHALTLMCQALIVAVALNSTRNGLVALLIANNFVEIKSTVFKKWDSTRIWALVCADAVERFHLLVVLSFVVVEEMDSAASWAPPPDYLRVCGLMVAAEVVIDVVKHAVLGKFNDVRPGIYREFYQDLCVKALAAQSHTAPRLLDFHHLAPAALTLRILLTLFWLRVDTRWQVLLRLLIVAVLYVILCGVKLLFGYCIKLLANYHTHYYTRKFGAKAYGARAVVPTVRLVGASGTGITASSMPAPAGQSTAALPATPSQVAAGGSTPLASIPTMVLAPTLSLPGPPASPRKPPMSPKTLPMSPKAPFSPSRFMSIYGSSTSEVASQQLCEATSMAAMTASGGGYGLHGPASTQLTGGVLRRMSGTTIGIGAGTSTSMGSGTGCDLNPSVAAMLLNSLPILGLGTAVGHMKED